MKNPRSNQSTEGITFNTSKKTRRTHFQKGSQLSAKYNIVTPSEKLAPGFFFLITTAASPLNFHDRLVYSFLCKYRKQDRIARKTEIALGCGLSTNKLKAVTSSLERLRRLGLVLQTGRTYIALQPTGEQCKWFVSRSCKAATHWTDSIAYYLVAIDGEPLECVLMALVQSLAQNKVLRRTSFSGLGKQLSLERRTVSNALAQSKSVRISPDGFNRIKIELIDDNAGFAGNAECLAAAAPEPQVRPSEAKAEPVNPLRSYEDYCQHLFDSGIDDVRVVNECIGLLFKIPASKIDVANPETKQIESVCNRAGMYFAYCGEARTEHAKAEPKSGTIKAKHFGHLLKWKLQQHVNNMKNERERNPYFYDDSEYMALAV